MEEETEREGEKIGSVGTEDSEVKNVSASGGDGEESDERAGKEGDAERWYWHTKQKEMMRAEVEDAFLIRKWVVGVLLVWGAGMTLAGLVVGRWVWNWIWG